MKIRLNLGKKLTLAILVICIFSLVVMFAVLNRLYSDTFESTLAKIEQSVLQVKRMDAGDLMHEIVFATEKSLQRGEDVQFLAFAEQQSELEEIRAFSFYGREGKIELSSDPQRVGDAVPNDVWQLAEKSDEMIVREADEVLSMYQPLRVDPDMHRLNPDWNVGELYGRVALAPCQCIRTAHVFLRSPQPTQLLEPRHAPAISSQPRLPRPAGQKAVAYSRVTSPRSYLRFRNWLGGQAMKTPLLIAVSAILWQATFTGPAIAAETGDCSTHLHFSPDRPVGWLVVLEPGTQVDDLKSQDIEKRRQLAKGDLRIPADKKVWMLISDPGGNESPTDFSVLDQFPPEQLIGLGIPFSNITAKRAALLPRHKGLRHLSFGPLSRVDDSALKPLEAMTWLEEFSVPETSVTDAGLRYLRKLTNLRKLTLYGTEITDTGLKHLRNMTELRELSLGHTKIEGPGLKHLKKLKKLERLVLWKTRIDDAALANLRQFPHLRSLDLQETTITDAGLQHLTPLEQLERLDLGSTRITDAGLKHLMKLRSLKTLLFAFTNLNNDAVRRLREARPRVTVYFEPPRPEPPADNHEGATEDPGIE